MRQIVITTPVNATLKSQVAKSTLKKAEKIIEERRFEKRGDIYIIEGQNHKKVSKSYQVQVLNKEVGHIEGTDFCMGFHQEQFCYHTIAVKIMEGLIQ